MGLIYYVARSYSLAFVCNLPRYKDLLNPITPLSHIYHLNFIHIFISSMTDSHVVGSLPCLTISAVLTCIAAGSFPVVFRFNSSLSKVSPTRNNSGSMSGCHTGKDRNFVNASLMFCFVEIWINLKISPETASLTLWYESALCLLFKVQGAMGNSPACNYGLVVSKHVTRTIQWHT